MTTPKKRLGKNFKRMVPIYEIFSKGMCDGLDFSDAAKHTLYAYETFGEGVVGEFNGYAYGKKMMDVTIAMWAEDMRTTLFIFELYEDDMFPNWWLDKIFPNKYSIPS